MSFSGSWCAFAALLLGLQSICAGVYAEDGGIHLYRTTPSPRDTVTTVRTYPPIAQRSTPCPVLPIRIEQCTQPPANTILNFAKTGLRRVGELFVRSPEARELYLNDNEISEISAMAFDELSRLEVLSLSGNNLPVDKLLWFKRHSSLSDLVIDDNKYSGKDTSVDAILHSLPRLRKLSLRRDRISKVNLSLKEFAPSLTHLDLSGNNINSTDFLANVPETLSRLCLDDNEISTVNEDSLENIEELSVSGNRITEVCCTSCTDYSLSLEGMWKLTKLNASRNSITNVGEDAFADTKRLTSLDLSRNKIRALSSEIFSRSLPIQELRLSHNQFTSIPNVCELTRLTHLDLSYNHIAEVTGKSFCILTQLQTLLLSNNHIINIDSGAFATLQMLHTLDLSSNVIAELPMTLITNARYLRVLSLANNSIANIDPLFHQRSTSLKELHLEENPLPSLTLAHMPHLTVHLKELKPYVAVSDAATTVDSIDDEDSFVDNTVVDGPVW